MFRPFPISCGTRFSLRTHRRVCLPYPQIRIRPQTPWRRWRCVVTGPQAEVMTESNGILAVVGEPAIRNDVDRVAAAAGLPVVHASDPSSRKAWTSAVAVLLDVAAARRCAHRALPRRGRVVLLVRSEPVAADFQAAIAVGAQHVITLPGHHAELMAQLSDAAEASRDTGRRGPVVGAIAGLGGAAAPALPTPLAPTAPDALPLPPA